MENDEAGHTTMNVAWVNVDLHQMKTKMKELPSKVSYNYLYAIMDVEREREREREISSLCIYFLMMPLNLVIMKCFIMQSSCSVSLWP